ncbi:RNA polymerase sigma-70 factor [Massilibacteroides vaginae]|uniref:RNA polymerase sigma-70 factor n=1 Tax=Massilibacteroides vaginae TaxID=1673718 RepID=UPI000A1CAB0B|nr:RNA polymerase sigma-70 factor [Massilibacteroides vaginae]
MKTNIDNKNSPELYSHLYEKYAPGLLFYARKFVSHQIAEDIVHDVFLSMWKKGNILFVEKSVVSYMFQSVQNRCINYLKKQNVRDEYKDKAIHDLKMEELTISSVEIKIIEREQIESIFKAIELLPKKNKEIFQLSYLKGKKNSEISDLLNISIRTVENHLYKALQELRKRLLP